ncbi:AAA family ATPase [Tritonibacter scottomollicae]|uniref:AAA family ATPase n=1 Tax=Tritonibacter scottomollicae TaxID=483013 RepID=UPI003BAAD1B5
MKINALKLSKLYSFGPPVELRDFSCFNLFIGPNGSGKTNVFRVLSGLPYDYSSIGQVVTQSQTHTAGTVIKNVTAFTPAFHEMSNTVMNEDAWTSDICGVLEIDYEEKTDVAQKSPVAKKIECRDSPDGHMEFVSGDVVLYARRVHQVVPAETDLAFFKQLCTVLSASKQRRSILNFALFYIFKLHYIFLENGTFIQGKKSGGGKVENDYQTLPSGVLQIAKTLLSVLEGQDRSVLLIDEPELHVEPRHLRAFFEFLVWYCSRSKNHVSPAETLVVDRVQSFLESAETGVNPLWREVPEKIGNTVHGKQVFVSSHSSVLINEFLRLSEAASLYEFRLTDMPFKRANKVLKHHTRKNDFESNLVGTFTDLRKINSISSSLLDGLGCKGSDLLQCNGVIWVEGPSDIIYIRKWLEIYARELDAPLFIQGRNYEFQMFGGTLLDSLCVSHDGLKPEDELKKLVEMFSFSRNAIVVIDSDARKDPETGEIVDVSNFTTAKHYISDQFATLKSEGYKLELWFEEGNERISTIEDYLPKSMLEGVPKLTKKKKAQRIVDGWGDEVKLSTFEDDLTGHIKTVWDTISTWNT